MSKAHWSHGDRVLLTSYGSTFRSGIKRSEAWATLPHYDDLDPAKNDLISWHQLAWIDLESTVDIWNQNRAPGPSGTGVRMQLGNLTPTWSDAALPPLTINPATAR